MKWEESPEEDTVSGLCVMGGDAGGPEMLRKVELGDPGGQFQLFTEKPSAGAKSRVNGGCGGPGGLGLP